MSITLFGHDSMSRHGRKLLASQRQSADDYIGQRIIDACLRENVCDIISRGTLYGHKVGDESSAQIGLTLSSFQHVGALVAEFETLWPEVRPDAWLHITHLSDASVYIPVVKSVYMQSWCAVSPGWFTVRREGTILYQQGFDAWLRLLSDKLADESKVLFLDYINEAKCAVSHSRVSAQACSAFRDKLSVVPTLYTPTDWQQSMLISDQIASYLDHPYYPTARAKVGFDTDALTQYAPEFSPQFALNWVAIPKSLITLTSATPSCWPTMAEVGLDATLRQSHQLFPLHPLNIANLTQLPEGAIMAPKTALMVQPTLSVRTLAVIAEPALHIKVPLLMATLGAKNIRLIKASTLYDGHWFEQTLTAIAQDDSKFKGKLSHVDEQHGGHLGTDNAFAYIVRRYPESMQDKHLVPVASLASRMPDKRLYLSHLSDHYYHGNWRLWFSEYLELMLSVHLRLWLKYGIALESNQQNAILGFTQKAGMSLIMKDNDSARLLASRYCDSALPSRLPEARVAQLRDKRILVQDDEALGQMFVTITLQLDIAAIIEAIANAKLASRSSLYRQLRGALCLTLDQLDEEGISTDYARHYLLAQSYLPVKYLLSSGSLLSKSQSGASDVNKYYGNSAPNFLHIETITAMEEMEHRSTSYLPPLTHMVSEVAG